jgi:hypothetical protein
MDRNTHLLAATIAYFTLDKLVKPGMDLPTPFSRLFRFAGSCTHDIILDFYGNSLGQMLWEIVQPRPFVKEILLLCC